MSVQTIARGAALAALLAATMVASHPLAHASGDVSPIWIPSGLALSYLLFGGPWYAAVVFAGAFAGSLIIGETGGAGPFMSAASAVEALTGWWLLGRAAPEPFELSRTAHVLRFIAVAFLASAVGGALGAAAVMVAGVLPVAAMAEAWRLWWLGNALGILTVTPAVLAWRGAVREPHLAREVSVALGVATVLAAAGAGAFFAGPGSELRAELLSLIVFPVVIWSGLRLGVRASTAGALALAVVAMAGTSYGFGEYAAYPSPGHQQIALQLYAFVVATSALVLAATVSERDARLVAQRRSESALLALDRTISSTTGEKFFRALVREVGSALGAKYVMAGEVVDPGITSVRTVAMSIDGMAAPNFTYSLRGTPCEGVVGRQTCVIERNVASLFPADSWLSDKAVETYLGVPLFGTAGLPLGLLVAMHDRPLPDPQRAAAILSLFAGRAAAELQRLRATSALAESEARLSLIYNAVADRLTLWEFDDEGALRLRSMNRATREGVLAVTGEGGEELDRRIGETYEALLRLRLSSLHAAEDATESIAALHATHLALVRRERQPVHFRETVRSEATSSIFDVTLTPVFDGGGTITHVLRAMRDVSRQVLADERSRELESTLRQAQRMEAIGTLAGGVAHDFNNILAGMLGYTELARLELDSRHRAAPLLDEVVTAVHRARDLIRQILTFSRGREGELRPVMLATVVREAAQLLRASLPSTIDLTFSCNAESAFVDGDPSQLHQVVMNLCTNAYHAIGDQRGAIDIAQAEVRVNNDAAKHDGIAAGTYVRLSVRDSGSGMTAATMEHIFEPFFTTKFPGEGTGLGLAVVHGIVKGHQGTIRVNSSPGMGSTFEILLPISAAGLVAPGVSTACVSGGRGEHVLFIDDERPVVASARRALEQLGYRVTAHDRASEALVSFADAPASFDIVVSDLTMPEIPGDQIVPMIRTLRPDIPVILTSGHVAALSAERLRALELSDVLPKPFLRDTLARAVRRALDAAELRVSQSAARSDNGGDAD